MPITYKIYCNMTYNTVLLKSYIFCFMIFEHTFLCYVMVVLGSTGFYQTRNWSQERCNWSWTFFAFILWNVYHMFIIIINRHECGDAFSIKHTQTCVLNEKNTLGNKKFIIIWPLYFSISSVYELYGIRKF